MPYTNVHVLFFRGGIQEARSLSLFFEENEVSFNVFTISFLVRSYVKIMRLIPTFFFNNTHRLPKVERGEKRHFESQLSFEEALKKLHFFLAINEK